MKISPPTITKRVTPPSTCHVSGTGQTAAWPKSPRRYGRIICWKWMGRRSGPNGGVRDVRNVELIELACTSEHNLSGLSLENKLKEAPRKGEKLTNRCFCGRVTSPSTNGSAPHSCSEPCSRPRPLCSHPCPLPCHPGPCPPCQVALIVPCPSHHTSLTVKCAAATGGASMTPVCDEVCGRERGCGDRKHTCQVRSTRL